MGGRPHEAKLYAAELRWRQSKGLAGWFRPALQSALVNGLVALGNQRDQ
jgi:hypothetical protein